MDYGLCLPNVRDVASPALIDESAALAEQLGWSTVWTTDHLLVEHAFERQYGTTFEALETLAWVGARHGRLRLGTSVLVAPMRNAVVLAKELATLDALSGGRLTVGVGAGWDEIEFGNVGVADRFHVRGAYTDETIRLWQHLWSGSQEPFEGRFHRFDDFVFRPLPAQGGAVPIVVGGQAPAALRRAVLAGGYQSTGDGPDAYAERVTALRRVAAEVGRSVPRLGARLAVRFDDDAGGSHVLRGDAEAIAADLRRFCDAGLDEVALFFAEPSGDRVLAAIERFDREVRPLVG